MAINTKLELRQTHSLVMTPQLQQAIKLLQLSNLELTSFVEAELERNPLLERADPDEPNGHAGDQAPELALNGKQEPAESAAGSAEAPSTEGESEAAEADDGEWIDLEKANGVSQTDDLDAEPQDVFPDAEAFAPGALKDSGWVGLGQGSRVDTEEGANLEAYVAEERTLRDHLSEQLVLAFADPAKRLIGQHLIDMTDEAGYLRGDLDSLADLLGAPQALIEETLAVMQGFEPCGVFARDLRECLTLQLKEQDRCDPAMAALIDNLHLLAAHDLPQLKRVARVSDEDLCDMIAEVKRLNPKPGLKYGSSPTQPIVPDVLVRALPDGSFHVELNSDTLPRVLVNQSYYATVSKSATRKEDKSYLVVCLQTASWLV
jgi:RNA polymerase sigma-54 factor